MFDLERILRRQLRHSMTHKQTLVFPEADDARIISAASRLIGFANILLIGDEAEVHESIQRGEAKLECSWKRFFGMTRVIDPGTCELHDSLGRRLHEMSQGRKWEMSEDEAAARILDPVFFAILCVREGYADAVLGGVAHSSRDFFQPCLRILEKEQAVYEMALFTLPDSHPAGLYDHNVVMFADVALNPVPTPETLANTAVGACRTMRDFIPLDVLPEINGAMLSYSTRGSGQGPSVQRIRAAEPLIRQQLDELRKSDPRYGSINIIAETQISVALSESAARTKLKDQYEDLHGAGRANVLIAPNLDVGNVLYHIYSTRYPDAKPTLIIGGLRDQALDFSRNSTPSEIARGALALLLRRCTSDRYRPTPMDFFFPRFHILCINPGSTSTKLALFHGEDEISRETVDHSDDELRACTTLAGQLPLRRAVIDGFLARHGVAVTDLHAVVGRGGLMRPVESGTYAIDQAMLGDLAQGIAGEHPANLGCPLAVELAREAGAKAFTVDPPVVDEFESQARLTGHAGTIRVPAWHALSQKAAGKHFAELRNLDYEGLNLIIAHLGGGITVGAHHKGRCVQVNNALYEGPITPNRTGAMPIDALLDLCFSGRTRAEVETELVRRGGLLSLLGTNDLREVERRIAEGDELARRVFRAMLTRIAAEIASRVPCFGGERIDRIILTGGLCRSRLLAKTLKRLLRPLNIHTTVYAGEREMEALRDGGLRVLRGVEDSLSYKL